jgi:hypothetical protein
VQNSPGVLCILSFWRFGLLLKVIEKLLAEFKVLLTSVWHVRWIQIMKKFVKTKVKYLSYQIWPQFSRFATIYPSRKMVTAWGLFFMWEKNNDLKRKQMLLLAPFWIYWNMKHNVGASAYILALFLVHDALVYVKILLHH